MSDLPFKSPEWHRNKKFRDDTDDYESRQYDRFNKEEIAKREANISQELLAAKERGVRVEDRSEEGLRSVMYFDDTKGPTAEDFERYPAYFREMNNQMGNSEFEAQVANRMGPLSTTGSLDAEYAEAHPAPVWGGDNHSPLGMYTPYSFSDTPYVYKDPETGDVVRGSGATAVPGVVRAYQPENWLWAHEFRHKTFDRNMLSIPPVVSQEDVPKSFVKNPGGVPGPHGAEEYSNRLWDAYTAQSSDEWDTAVQTYHWGHKRGDRDLKDSEKQLLSELDKNESKFHDLEWKHGRGWFPTDKLLKGDGDKSAKQSAKEMRQQNLHYKKILDKQEANKRKGALSDEQN